MLARCVSTLTALAFISSCSSSTALKSRPAGAIVYVNGAEKCETPCTYESSSPGGDVTFVIKKPGYEPETISIRRNKPNIGRIVAFSLTGFVLFPLWFGLFWHSDYEPEHHVTMRTWDESEKERQRDVDAQGK